MSQIVIGHYEPDGGDIYLPIGFKPDYFELVEFGASDILTHRMFGQMQADEASGSREGILDDGDGTFSKNADDAGFEAYDSESAGPTITRWSAGATVVAKTATAHGTYMKPSTSSDMDKEAVFEVLANTTTGTTEPTWPAGIGETVKDNHGSPVQYERVDVPTLRIGYQGMLIADDIQNDGQEMYYIAIQADKVVDHGDVDSWTGGIYGA